MISVLTVKAGLAMEPLAPEPDIGPGVQASGGVEDLSRLLSTLLTNYSSNVMPMQNRSSPVEVQLGMGIMSIVNLDTRTQVLSLRGYAKGSWTDISLRWDPADYGNVTYVILQQNAIWKPDIMLANSLRENNYLGNEETKVYVDYRGLIMWQPVFTSGFKCQVDISRYPMDSNICAIALHPWMHDNSHVKLYTSSSY